jgi:hypothetical protein
MVALGPISGEAVNSQVEPAYFFPAHFFNLHLGS